MGKRTQTAFGTSCRADFSTKQNDTVAEIGAFLRRQTLAKLHFYFVRICAGRQAKLAANADTMGIAYNTARNAKNIT